MTILERTQGFILRINSHETHSLRYLKLDFKISSPYTLKYGLTFLIKGKSKENHL